MISLNGPAYTEIGQIVLTNGTTHEHEADWATVGINILAEVISEYRGHKKGKLDHGLLITSQDGDEPFENEVFSIRPYCVCEGDILGHEDGCPSNFIHKDTGIEISWYEHSGKGITSNVDWIPVLSWHRIINECIESVVKINISGKQLKL